MRLNSPFRNENANKSNEKLPKPLPLRLTGDSENLGIFHMVQQQNIWPQLDAIRFRSHQLDGAVLVQ
jgi:hypothetical protein